MIQEIIDWLTQEKLQYHLTEQKLNYKANEAKMLVIESVYWFEKVQELDRRPMNIKEANEWSEEKAKNEIEVYYMRARKEIYDKRHNKSPLWK